VPLPLWVGVGSIVFVVVRVCACLLPSVRDVSAILTVGVDGFLQTKLSSVMFLDEDERGRFRGQSCQRSRWRRDQSYLTLDLTLVRRVVGQFSSTTDVRRWLCPTHLPVRCRCVERRVSIAVSFQVVWPSMSRVLFVSKYATNAKQVEIYRTRRWRPCITV